MLLPARRLVEWCYATRGSDALHLGHPEPGGLTAWRSPVKVTVVEPLLRSSAFPMDETGVSRTLPWCVAVLAMATGARSAPAEVVVVPAGHGVSEDIEITQLAIGDSAPEFELFGVDVRYHSLEMYEGRKVLRLSAPPGASATKPVSRPPSTSTAAAWTCYQAVIEPCIANERRATNGSTAHRGPVHVGRSLAMQRSINRGRAEE